MRPLHTFPAKATLTLGAFLSLSIAAVAQNGALRRADARYEALAFAQAAPLYEEAALKGAPLDRVAPKLADSYWRMRDLSRANTWYARLAARPNPEPLHLYRYSETLRSMGRFSAADSVIQRYEAIAATDSRAERQRNAQAYAARLEQANAFGARLLNLNINTARCDMGAAYLGDRVTFASAHRQAAADRQHTWNGEPFLDLYSGKPSSSGALADVSSLGAPFNTRYHDSNTSATTDAREVWFTRNNYEGSKRRTDDKGVTRLKIFSSTRDAQGAWADAKPFPYNSDSYSVGHPALSADGKRLYFASDRPGGVGGTDIWYCERTATGGWAEPINAGRAVNTEGNELFPFAAQEGLLFFASDGHQGLGGLDVLMTTVKGSSFGAARNPGAPINSRSDDFSFVLAADGLNGYLTSDRPGGKGDDDIYAFTLTKKPGVRQRMEGVAQDPVTRAPLAGVRVLLTNAQGTPVDSVVTAADGRYSFDVEHSTTYRINGTLADRRPGNAELPALPEADTLVVRDLELLEARMYTLLLRVTDAATGKPLEGVHTILSKKPVGTVLVDANTSATGELRTTLDNAAKGDALNMTVRLEREGYVSKNLTYSEYIGADPEIKVHGALDLSMQPLEVGADLGKLIDIKPIYFDLGKHAIRKDAAAELDKIVAAMKEYPTMIIELGSHTDCRSSIASNAALSDRRAKSSAAYIVSKGIVADRISGKGYGESKLINGCACEGAVKSTCSEAEHQLNRRTEFIIVKM